MEIKLYRTGALETFDDINFFYLFLVITRIIVFSVLCRQLIVYYHNIDRTLLNRNTYNITDNDKDLNMNPSHDGIDSGDKKVKRMCLIEIQSNQYNSLRSNRVSNSSTSSWVRPFVRLVQLCVVATSWLRCCPPIVPFTIIRLNRPFVHNLLKFPTKN